MRVQFELDRNRDDPITIMFCGSLLASLDRKYFGPVVTKIVTSRVAAYRVILKMGGPLKFKIELNG